MMDNEIDKDGFSVVSGVLGARQIDDLGQGLAPLVEASPSVGVRGLVEKVSCVRLLAQSSVVRALVEPILGAEARLVRSVLFNKSPEANWQVAWHQDLAIAVQHQAEVEGFVSWSTKEGVPHVQPPVSILEQMLTVRLHLDAADESNGALWVSPGSHRLGRLPAGEAAAVAESQGKHMCAVKAGDALLCRPLILHASRKARSNRPRRVIHLEFSGIALPDPLVWAEAAV